APLFRQARRAALGRIWISRCVQPDGRLVCAVLARHRPGADRLHDREPPQRTALAAPDGLSRDTAWSRCPRFLTFARGLYLGLNLFAQDRAFDAEIDPAKEAETAK